MKKVLLPIIMIFFSGCGTTTTLTNVDSDIKSKLARSNSSCEKITRVYSGVAYDFCRLQSTPDSSFYNPFLVAYLVDIPFSAVTDTVVLPFTIYNQSNNGSLDVAN